jgi:hypothetical protein
VSANRSIIADQFPAACASSPVIFDHEWNNRQSEKAGKASKCCAKQRASPWIVAERLA